jgi:hypothetical protein
MFCPVCHAEYRQGFTQCADCGVALLHSLPDNAGEHGLPDDDSVQLLWSGIDPRFFKVLKAVLDEAHIDYTDATGRPQLISTGRDNVLQIWVRSAGLEAAKKLLRDVSGTGAGDDETTLDAIARSQASSNPFHPLGRPVFNRNANDDDDLGEEEPEAEDDAAEVPEDFVENFDPDEATVVVWAGEDSQMANIFQECLSNVGIGCVLNANMGKTQVLVMPAAENRAREVVREIEEGSPMA